MFKTTVYLDEETLAALRQIAAATRRPQAELIREAVAEYTVRVPRKMPAGAGAFRSGRSDLSEKAETLLTAAARKRRF